MKALYGIMFAIILFTLFFTIFFEKNTSNIVFIENMIFIIIVSIDKRKKNKK